MKVDLKALRKAEREIRYKTTYAKDVFVFYGISPDLLIELFRLAKRELKRNAKPQP